MGDELISKPVDNLADGALADGDHMKNSTCLRRSIISVPANREKMVNKAFSLDADVIMLDLEDSVPVNEKEEARKRVVSILQGTGLGRKAQVVSNQWDGYALCLP